MFKGNYTDSNKEAYIVLLRQPNRNWKQEIRIILEHFFNFFRLATRGSCHLAQEAYKTIFIVLGELVNGRTPH